MNKLKQGWERKKSDILSDVLQILHTARQKAYTAINLAMVEAYWLLGKRIVEEEQNGVQKAVYGEAILKTLSIALTAELGRGFSYANLRNFRQFYLTYPDGTNCYALRSNLSWTHHRLIMRVENPNAKAYYIKECEEQNWSSRSLERNINTFYYERILSSHDKSNVLKSNEPLEKSNLNDFVIKNACVMTSKEYNNVLDVIENWTRSSYNGVSFRKDLAATCKLDGKVLVAFTGEDPTGFLAYSKTLLPTLWGAVDSSIKNIKAQKEVMEQLLINFNEINGFEEVVLQMNSRHNQLVDLIIEMGFKLYRSVNRMYLNGFEGDHLKKSDKLIMRPWRG